MTTEGNLNINNLNTVKVPTINMGLGTIVRPISNISGTSGLGFYYDSKNAYYIGDDTGAMYIAPFRDPANCSIRYNALLPSAAIPGNIYPTAISGHFYSYGVRDTSGASLNSVIWSASSNSPFAWYSTGDSSPSDSLDAMIYYDGTNIYLLGGVDTTGTYLDTVDVAAIGSPTTFTTSGNTLPDTRIFGMLATIGSTIYMYGGTDNGSTSKSTIYTASTTDPTTWTDSGDSLPITIDSANIYVDDTSIYIFGGNNSGAATTLDTIYIAPIGTPTTFTLSGSTLSAPIQKGKIIVSNGYIYLVAGQSTGGDIGIMRASVSDPLTWTQVSDTQTLSTAQAGTHIGVHGSKIYAFGGFNSAGSASTVIQSAPTDHPAEWSNESAVLPAGLYGGQLIKTSKYFYIIGGDGTTGNFYRALLSSPTTWTLADITGPNVRNGKCIIVDSHLWYFGGETAGPTAVATGWRALIVDGEIINWLQDPSITEMIFILPTTLSRYAMVQAGDYVYAIGGFTGTPATPNTVIYRAQINRLSASVGFTSWTSVGSLTHPPISPAIAIVNNYLYLIGGTTAGNITSSDDYVITANMNDLANGSAIFVEENTAISAISDSVATCVNNDLYLVGGRTATNGTNSLFKNLTYSTHQLILPKVPESVVSIPTIDTKTGNIGSYSVFQRTGMLPWLITDK